MSRSWTGDRGGSQPQRISGPDRGRFGLRARRTLRLCWRIMDSTARPRRTSAPITLDDIYSAREIVTRTLRRTPLLQHPLLDAETGLSIYVKHENHNPTTAFKVRGGLNLVARLSGDERRGVVTATTGNHGQSIAMA